MFYGNLDTPIYIDEIGIYQLWGKQIQLWIKVSLYVNLRRVTIDIVTSEVHIEKQ